MESIQTYVYKCDWNFGLLFTFCYEAYFICEFKIFLKHKALYLCICTMDGMLNVFLGRKHNVFNPNMISSTTVTVIQMVAMLDGNNFREAFIILLLLNDVIRAYIV